MMLARDVLPCLTVLTFLVGVVPAAAVPFTGIVAFGDSLSDAGNVYNRTGGAEPAPPYVNGHFSNGPTWVEDLSQNLGLGALGPSRAGGTDFAFGGAVTGTSVPGTLPLAVPDLTQQVAHFLSSTSGVAPSTDLYSVEIGVNDVIQALADVLGASLTVPVAQADLANAAKTEEAAVQTLAVAGAMTFLVPLVPDLGVTPVGSGAAAALATGLSANYNTDLVSDLNTLAASDHITVHYLDVFSLIDAIVSNPIDFGLNNVTDACYTGPLTGGEPPDVCTNPNQYLFWDTDGHPTEVVQEQVAAIAQNELVPEPSSLALFGAGLAGLVALRRHRRCSNPAALL